MREALAMDLYELTMSYVYFKKGMKDTKVAFDLFFRRTPDEGSFVVFAGLASVIDYVKNLKFTEEQLQFFKKKNKFDDDFIDYLRNFKFTGDIYSLEEGRICYPNMPMITVVAPIIEAQIIETALLLFVNHQSLIATKARRMVHSAAGKSIMEFGARRAHGIDASVEGARAAFIGGVNTTSNVLADFKYGIDSVGTMAHSFVELFDDEYEAFKNYAEIYSDDCVFLVDTYDTLKSGIPNAIKVAQEVLIPAGKRLKGIRLDSGDLAYLSAKAREMLDAAKMEDCKIIASNSIDEFTIQTLINQGAKIDIFGIGERLITAKSEPVFGGVYKLVAVEEENGFEPRIKVSENVVKITNPGLKKAYRVYDIKTGKSTSDILVLASETENGNILAAPFVDSLNPLNLITYNPSEVMVEELLIPIFANGELVYDTSKHTLEDAQNFVKMQLRDEIWETEQRIIKPHTHYVNHSKALYELKVSMLNEKTRKDR